MSEDLQALVNEGALTLPQALAMSGGGGGGAPKLEPERVPRARRRLRAVLLQVRLLGRRRARSRGIVGRRAQHLSAAGPNITDTYPTSKHGQRLFTVRPDNFNEKLGVVRAGDVALVAGNGERAPLRPVTLRDFLKTAGKHGAYAGLESDVELGDRVDDENVSNRFQTTFLPVGADGRGSLLFRVLLRGLQLQHAP